MRFLSFFLVLLVLSSPLSAAKKKPSEELKKVETTLKKRQALQKDLRQKSQSLEKEIETLQKRMASLAGTIQRQEELLNRLDDVMGPLNEKLQSEEKRLNEKRSEMIVLVAALQRLALQPPETILISPQPLNEATKVGVLLKTAVQQVEETTSKIANRIEKIAYLREEVEKKKKYQEELFSNIQSEKSKLQELSKKKGSLRQNTLNEVKGLAREISKLANEASSLKELMAKLERKKRRAKTKAQIKESAKSFKKRRGKLKLPAKGSVIAKFKSEDKYGHHIKGIKLKTRAKSQVVIPYSGDVMYEGNFRGYGKMMIVDHGGGYITLLAGLDRLDREIGESLVSGEPIGIMGAGNPILYIELRHNGRPIDPLKWYRK